MDVSLAISDVLVELATVGEEYNAMKERVFRGSVKSGFDPLTLRRVWNTSESRIEARGVGSKVCILSGEGDIAIVATEFNIKPSSKHEIQWCSSYLRIETADRALSYWQGIPMRTGQTGMDLRGCIDESRGIVWFEWRM
jgi:hypothetical protein